MGGLVDADCGRGDDLHHSFWGHRHGSMIKGGNWCLVKGCSRKVCTKKKEKIIIFKTVTLYKEKVKGWGGDIEGTHGEGKTVRKKVTTKWWYFTKASPWQQFYDLNRSYFFETPTEGEFTGEGREGGWVREKEERTASRSTPFPVLQTPHINSLGSTSPRSHWQVPCPWTRRGITHHW